MLAAGARAVSDREDRRGGSIRGKQSARPRPHRPALQAAPLHPTLPPTMAARRLAMTAGAGVAAAGAYVALGRREETPSAEV